MLPPAVKKIAMVFSDTVKVFSCENAAELLKIDKPLEIFIVAQTKDDKVEKHFMVGLIVPCKTDDFKTPQLYIAALTYEQYIKYEAILKEKMKVKDVDRKSNIWMPNA